MLLPTTLDGTTRNVVSGGQGTGETSALATVLGLSTLSRLFEPVLPFEVLYNSIW